MPRIVLFSSALIALACGDPDVYETVYLGLADPPAGTPHASGCASRDTELNDSLTTAVVLPPMDSCSASTTGVVAGSNDVDYFRFDGIDALACTNVPCVRGSAGVRVCLFPVCSEGATELNGCVTGAPQYILSGLIGCCAEDGVAAQPTRFSCTAPSSTGSASIYVRVDLPTQDSACHEYTLDYSL